MKIIITEDQYGQLTEMIKLDIKVGDTIMGGKFKNKKVVVKTIGKNDKGDITINGKPLLRFRILKENNFHLRRRENIMKEKLDSIIQNRFTNEEFQFMPFEHFRLHISDYVGTEMANELNLTGDEKVTFRNQIIQYVRNNFYEYLKEIWESKQNINESDKGNNIPSALRRRINLFDHELNTTLRESEPCEYARFNQYKRGIMNYTLASFLNNENISLDSDENYFEIRNYLLNIFENKIRLHYDAYSEIHCPDDPEIVTESKLQFIRRYQELKDWVRSDYNYLLDQGKSPYEAREMTIDHSPITYLDDPETEIEWTDERFIMLRRFVENNFEDLIS